MDLCKSRKQLKRWSLKKGTLHQMGWNNEAGVKLQAVNTLTCIVRFFIFKSTWMLAVLGNRSFLKLKNNRLAFKFYGLESRWFSPCSEEHPCGDYCYNRSSPSCKLPVEFPDVAAVKPTFTGPERRLRVAQWSPVSSGSWSLLWNSTRGGVPATRTKANTGN